MINETGKRYNNAFFESIDETSAVSAHEVVPVLMKLVDAKSVIDVGCGIGSWLREFQQNGIADYIGVDGDYVDPNQLRIPVDRFVSADLKQPLLLKRKFDLAICLEVGEHLPDSSADILVRSLAALADVVAFSAAVPFQAGRNHINMQWPSYWADRFSALGFDCYDCVRPVIWENPKVASWFAQNILLYCRPSELSRIHPEHFPLEFYKGRPKGIVHPIHYMAELESGKALHDLREIPNVSWAIRALLKSMKSSVRYRSGRLLGHK
jgi:SAM-dependent methyltransferase